MDCFAVVIELSFFDFVMLHGCLLFPCRSLRNIMDRMYESSHILAIVIIVAVMTIIISSSFIMITSTLVLGTIS